MFRFKDTSPTVDTVYTVTLDAPFPQVSLVNIQAVKVDQHGGIFLQLCEVQVYGGEILSENLTFVFHLWHIILCNVLFSLLALTDMCTVYSGMVGFFRQIDLRGSFLMQVYQVLIFITQLLG